MQRLPMERMKDEYPLSFASGKWTEQGAMKQKVFSSETARGAEVCTKVIGKVGVTEANKRCMKMNQQEMLLILLRLREQ